MEHLEKELEDAAASEKADQRLRLVSNTPAVLDNCSFEAKANC